MIISLELRLDENGLIQKECPYCNLEYKILPESETEDYRRKSYCPSCGLHSSFDNQLTKVQVEYIQQEFMNNVVEQLNGTFKKMSRNINSKNVKFKYKPLKKSDARTVIELLGLEGVNTNCCNEIIFLDYPNTYKLLYCPKCGEISFPAN